MAVADRLRPTGERARLVLRIVMRTYDSWRKDRTIRLGAGLAYYGLFSLASVLTLSFGMLQFVTKRSDTEAWLTERFEELLGDSGVDLASMLAERLDGAVGTQLGLIGLGSLIVTGSLFFVALEDALNQIWGMPVRPGIRASIRRRLVAFVVLIATAATLIVSLTVQAVTSLLTAIVPGSAADSIAFNSLIASSLSWLLLAGAVCLLLRFLPSADVAWRAAMISGGVTSALLIVGTALIGWYLRTFAVSSVSGAASAVIAVLVWIYYEAQILLAGAQLSKVLGTAAEP